MVQGGVPQWWRVRGSGDELRRGGAEKDKATSKQSTEDTEGKERKSKAERRASSAAGWRTRPGVKSENYRMLSLQFSRVCLSLAMNWCATAPSTTRWS